MIKKSSIKIAALLLLLVVFSSSGAYAAGRESFRLHFRNPGTGEFITVTDGGALDLDSSYGEIKVDHTIFDSYVQITVAATEPNSTSVLTLSSSVAHTGLGALQFIIEDIYSSSVTNGSFRGFVGGLMADLYEDNLSDLVDIYGATANFNVFMNASAAVPADDGTLPVPAGQAAFGAGGLNVLGAIPTVSSAAYNFNFEAPSPDLYSIFSVASITFTDADVSNSIDFSLRGSVVTTGGPLIGATVPEPISLLLLGSGLLGLGVLRRRQGPTA